MIFFLSRKIKKSEPIINDNKENNKNLTHVNTTQKSSDKFSLIYNSTESSPRDRSSLSSPPHKVR
jgi:hypothetical protein